MLTLVVSMAYRKKQHAHASVSMAPGRVAPGAGRATRVKQIIAIIKPFLAEKVLEGLKRAPLEACSVREVKGYGRQKSYLDQYGDSEYSLAFLPKVEITLWVDDNRAEEIYRKIIELARTGRMGDGKIFVVATPERVIDF
jgi:nitrogen regulatory protein P-II 1